MSKEKRLTMRMQELFSGTKPVPPEPEEHPNQPLPVERLTEPSPPLVSAPQSAVEPAQKSTLEQHGGWSDYLDAIRRSEHIRFSYAASLEGDASTPENGGRKLSTPLVLGNAPIGELEIQPTEGQRWEQGDENLVASVAERLVQHLENLRLLDQADQYRAEAEHAVQRMTQQGWRDYLDGRETTISGFIYDHDRVRPLDPLTSQPAGQAVTQPVVVRDAPIGTLVVEAETGKVPEDVVASIAQRLGLHIENLRLLEQTENARQQLDRRAAELETVARVGTAAATILEPDLLLQTVVDLTQENFNLYHVQVFQVDAPTRQLTLVAGSGRIGRAMVADTYMLRMDNSQATVARVARTRSGIIVEDTRLMPDYEHYPFLPDTLSELAVPMVVGDQVLGVFSVLSSTARRYIKDDMRTFATLAAQVAVALRNAEFYAEQMATVERLRELDQLKSSFLANMSHELRTPLNSILGFSQVILEGLDGPLTADMDNDLRLIERNGRHLLTLITDILDMAKIEAGRLTISKEWFDLSNIMKEVLETMQPLVRERSLYLKYEADPNQNLVIHADTFRIRQILINLIGNAIKFTERGGITLQAQRMDRAVRVCVSDTGIGIPDDKLDSIFEAFTQVDTSMTRKVGGTGLGLPISRRLVEMHGGKLWAESTGKPGDGSALWMELPVEKGMEQV